jgi:hypothetical protein
MANILVGYWRNVDLEGVDFDSVCGKESCRLQRILIPSPLYSQFALFNLLFGSLLVFPGIPPHIHTMTVTSKLPSQGYKGEVWV